MFDRVKGLFGGAGDEAGNLLGGMNIETVQQAVNQLPPGALESAIQTGMNALPANARDELGPLVGSFLKAEGQGAAVPSGVEHGEAAALAEAIAGMVQNGGIERVVQMFAQTSESTTAGGAVEAIGSLLGKSGGQVDFAQAMTNPLARQVMEAVGPAILQAANKQ
jgi:hypothetical protein